MLFWKKLNLHQRLATIGCGAGLMLFVVFGWKTGLGTRLLYIFDVYWLLLMMMILEELKGNTRLFYVVFLTIVGFGLYCKSLVYVEPYSVFHDWDARLVQPLNGNGQNADEPCFILHKLSPEVTNS